MGRIAEWWRLRPYRKKERFVERNAREEYALVGNATKVDEPRFTGATSVGLIAVEMELRYGSTVALVTYAEPETLLVRVGDDDLVVRVEFSTDDERLDVATLATDDSTLATLRRDDTGFRAFNGDDDYAFHLEHPFVYAGKSLVGQFTPVAFRLPRLGIALTEELPRWPVLLFGALKSINLEPAWVEARRQHAPAEDESS